MIRILPTRFHGFLDYISGLCMTALPFVFKFNNENAVYSLLISGIITIFYSLLTDYEWGLSKAISMHRHLQLDVLLGILLALSPWALGFYETVFMPHLIAAGLLIISAFITHHLPSYKGYHASSYKRYEMPVYGKFEKFPPIKL